MRLVAFLLLLGPLGLLSANSLAQNSQSDFPLGVLEEFALAEDRAAVVAKLVPGTRDYYFFSCLERQHAGDLEAIPALLASWDERHGRTTRWLEIENRQALLRFGDSPESTYAFLRKRLRLRFDQQRKVPGAEVQLETSLDPARVSREAFVDREESERAVSLRGYNGSALRDLAQGSLSNRRLGELLDRLQRPDVPGLAQLVVRDLAVKTGRPFGSRSIHFQLLLEQLDTCLALRPQLLADNTFIDSYMKRLQPSADVDWRHDANTREAFLERTWAFAKRLPPSQNSLKSYILQRRLEHDLLQGQLDRERFLAWLQLPRKVSWINAEFLARSPQTELAKGPGFPELLGPVGDQQVLLRAYLEYFLATDASPAQFASLVEQRYLERVFAETKILLGEGDMERWYSLLDDPSYYERLHQRVELRFAATQPTYYGAADPVHIAVDLKNVGTLLVKVFEIDTLGYYLAKNRDIDASLDLDGLIAGDETTYEYSDNPLRRIRRDFHFPQLSGPGVYVVEFIAGGLSSRAVIRKGRLQLRERLGSAGHVLSVVDELGSAHPKASVWLAGREYSADEDGEIYLPYSADPGLRDLVLRSGERSSRASLEHRAESYQLEAGIVLDRESLLSDGGAQLLLRPRLSLHGHGASMELLQDAVLSIRSTNGDGTQSSFEHTELAYELGSEIVLPFQVPRGTRRIEVKLRGKIQSINGPEMLTVAAEPVSFYLNGIDGTAETEAMLLGKDDQGWFMDVLGKNGEPRMGYALSLDLRHEDFTNPMRVQLATGVSGRTRLGNLPGITHILFPGSMKEQHAWSLNAATVQPTHTLQGTTTGVLRVPLAENPGDLRAPVASLLELRGDLPSIDRRDHLHLQDGYLELRDLPAGDYDLWVYDSQQGYDVHITAGAVREGWAQGKHRWLQLSPQRPLQVSEPQVEGEQLIVRVQGASPNTRVQILSNRYAAPYDYSTDLATYAQAGLGSSVIARAETDYHSGRSISDEYRYVLERRFAKAYPGNMLERPGLLLNPWATDETNSVIGIGGGAGGKFGGRSGGKRNTRAAGGRGSHQSLSERHPAAFPNLDFLPQASAMLVNLRLDKDGVLRVPLASLGEGQWIHVLVVDQDQLASTDLALPWNELTPKDLRLHASMDANEHFTESRRIEYLAAGDSAVIADVTASDAQSYDSLASVFRLYQTLAPGAGLDSFEFLLEWGTTAGDKKRQLYSRFACHELHLFLYEKDRAFFDSVIKPYLANKGAKTFLDHWLLEDDLTTYLEPWNFGRLNVLERVLLGRRFTDQSASIAALVRDQVQANPAEPARLQRLFDMALAGGALDAGAGLNESLRSMRKSVLDKRSKSRSGGPASPGPAGPGAPGASTPGAPAGAPGGGGIPSKRGRLELEESEEEPILEDFEVADAPATGSDEFFLGRGEKEKKDAGRRRQTTRLFQALAQTSRYLESNYWKRQQAEQGSGLLTVHGFWLDFAQADPQLPFLSANFAQASGSLNEILLALALLDLPYQSAEHTTAAEGSTLSIRAGSPLLLVRKDLAAAEQSADAPRVLVAQDIYRLDARYVRVNGRQVESFVSGDLRAGVAYGCRVVVTNPNGIARELELLLQIPQGALPLEGENATRGKHLSVDAYGTGTLEYTFYFPSPGEFTHYPLHAGEAGSLLAWAEGRTLKVTDEPLQVDNRSWEHISQSGTQAEVLAYLGDANLLRTDLSRLAWRLRDRGFFSTVTRLLRSRHSYDNGTWSYALHHGDEPRAVEFLQHADQFIRASGPLLQSRLLNIDPVARGRFEQVDYQPLVNARAHALAGERTIANQDLKSQYSRWLDVLAHRPALTSTDRLTLTYYLLLQDRIEEALASFGQIESQTLSSQLQYDYLAAYVDFYSDDHTLARGIAERYQEHPVPRWRERFQTVLRQLEESEGRTHEAGSGEDSTGTEAMLAAEPALDLEVAGGQIVLHHSGIEQVELRYYAMDVEFRFSTSPFVQQGTGAFAYVRPNRTDPLALDAKVDSTSFALPAEFNSSNVIVEVRGAGVIRRKAHYANALSVLMLESAGQLKVTHATSGEPLSKVYVKVYALSSGKPRFHKDGYTDLRGRFDYTSVSNGGDRGVQRFAILVLSEEDGAVIREVAPPLR